MSVSNEHQVFIGSGQQRLQLRIAASGVDSFPIVGARCGMDGQNSKAARRCDTEIQRQSFQPVKPAARSNEAARPCDRGSDPGEYGNQAGVSLDGLKSGRRALAGYDVAIRVASRQNRPVEHGQPLENGSWLGTNRAEVADRPDLVRTQPMRVGQYRIKGRDIAMNVGKNGNAHAIIPAGFVRLFAGVLRSNRSVILIRTEARPNPADPAYPPACETGCQHGPKLTPWQRRSASGSNELNSIFLADPVKTPFTRNSQPRDTRDGYTERLVMKCMTALRQCDVHGQDVPRCASRGSLRPTPRPHASRSFRPSSMSDQRSLPFLAAGFRDPQQSSIRDRLGP
jgi:hypothetical protein